MGFRSTFVTNDYSIQWPNWLKEKYKDSVNFDSCASSKSEQKFYGTWNHLVQDFHKALNEIDYFKHEQHLTILILHECDGVTRYQLYKNEIVCSEPTPFNCWERKKEITHHYCYNCQNTNFK